MARLAKCPKGMGPGLGRQPKQGGKKSGGGPDDPEFAPRPQAEGGGGTGEQLGGREGRETPGRERADGEGLEGGRESDGKYAPGAKENENGRRRGRWEGPEARRSERYRRGKNGMGA